MGIDLKKMRAKMDALENKGGKNIFWRPEDGETTIRLVPTADGDPFKEYWFHYNVGNNPGFLIPKKNFGEEDPLDDFIRQLYREGGEDNTRLAKKLGARQRFFTPVIVRGQEDEGVKIWGYGKMAYKELLSLVLNPDYGDITDTAEGTDLVINYGKPVGAQFPQTSITPRRKTSALSDDENQVHAWLDSIPNFEEVFERKTPEEVRVMLDEFLLGQDDAEELSTESTRYNSGDSQTDRAFKELLNG